MFVFLNKLIERLFGPLNDYLRARTERRVAIGRLIDILLEVRHRAAVILAVEAALGEALRDVPPQGRILLRMALRAGQARLGPVAKNHTVEELRERLAGYHPGLAFRMRNLADFADEILGPPLQVLEQDGSLAAAHLSNHLAVEIRSAHVDVLDDVLGDLADLHGREAAADVASYIARFNEPNADRDRAMQGVIPLLREALRTAPWDDPKGTIETFQQALAALSPPSQLSFGQVPVQ